MGTNKPGGGKTALPQLVERAAANEGIAKKGRPPARPVLSTKRATQNPLGLLEGQGGNRPCVRSGLPSSRSRQPDP
jgi:hypothetical protein